MKANEFCYWLQGFFEIGAAQGAPSESLKAPAVECIRAHLELVKAADPGHSNVFVAWLSERLRNQPHHFDVADVTRFLAAQFKHVIDQSYAGDQKKMNQIHGASGVAPENVLYRC